MTQFPRLSALLIDLSEGPVDADPAWLFELVAALRPETLESAHTAIERVEALVSAIEQSPTLATQLAARIAALTNSRRVRYLMASTGVLQQPARIVAEIARRFSERVLPPIFDPSMMRDIFDRAFARSSDADWVEEIPIDIWERCARAIMRAAIEKDVHFPGLRKEALAAIETLTHQLAGIGVDREWLRYDPLSTQHESPFIAQSRYIATWVNEVEVNPTVPAARTVNVDHALMLLDQCDAAIHRIHTLANTQGTSLAISGLIVQGQGIVARLRDLLALVTATDALATSPIITKLFLAFVCGVRDARSVRALLRTTTDTLALRVTEHASHTGEHYMTATREEYWTMAKSALGAGPIVGAMALVKFMIVGAHFAPFWEWFLSGMNYASGFVLVHLLHYTIATKQPAMTAARIAAKMSETSQHNRISERLSAVSETVEQVTRTQFIAVVGNIALAIPAGFLLAWLWAKVFGKSLIGVEKSHTVFTSLHPLLSGSLIFAALAGVCLFIAGSLSGYADNRALYSRIPERLRAAPWVNALLGEDSAQRLGDYFEHNAGAIFGNILLGFLLPFVTFLGVLFGLPLDIRHVTLSAATLGFGVVGLHFAPPWMDVAFALIGMVLIGLVNLSVSFGLALYTAMKSRGIHMDSSRTLLRLVWKRFKAAPSTFLFTPSRAATVPAEDASEKKS